MEFDAFDPTLLQQWVGKTTVCHDVIDARQARALAAVLNKAEEFPDGAVLPPLWHGIYFRSTDLQEDIGSDGHQQRGNFLPPITLQRRMWAGSRLRFAAPLLIGAAVKRTSRIAQVETKSGRSGDLAFVTISHEITSHDTPVLHEEHDIVYCEPPQPGAVALAPRPAPKDACWSRQIMPDPVLLFRYSALTFNAYRIHYDRSYATAVEAYPGLVVHGSLVATLLLELLRHHVPQARLVDFCCRSVTPLFDFEPFFVCGKPDSDGGSVQLWAHNIHGELAMQAEARLAR